MKTIILIFMTMNLSFANQNYIDSIIDKNKHYKNTVERIQEYAPTIIELSNQLDINPILSLSIAWTESHFKPYAVSYTGDIGIMQLQPNTNKYMQESITKSDELRRIYTRNIGLMNSHSIYDNIFIGVLYLRYLQSKFDNDMDKVIVAYNRGPSGANKLFNKNTPLENIDYFNKVKGKFDYIVSYAN